MVESELSTQYENKHLPLYNDGYFFFFNRTSRHKVMSIWNSPSEKYNI